MQLMIPQASPVFRPLARYGLIHLLALSTAGALLAQEDPERRKRDRDVSEPYGDTSAAEVLAGVSEPAVAVEEIDTGPERSSLMLFQTESIDRDAPDLGLDLKTAAEQTAFRRLLGICSPDALRTILRDFSDSDRGAWVTAKAHDKGLHEVFLAWIPNPEINKNSQQAIRKGFFLGVPPGPSEDIYRIEETGASIKIDRGLETDIPACTVVRILQDRLKHRTGFLLFDAESSLLTSLQYGVGSGRSELRTTWDNTDLGDGLMDRERVTGQFRVSLRPRTKQNRYSQIVLIADYRDQRGSVVDRSRVYLSGSYGWQKNGKRCRRARGCQWGITPNVGWQEKTNSDGTTVDDFRLTLGVTYNLTNSASVNADYSVNNDVDGQSGYGLVFVHSLGDHGRVSIGIAKDGPLSFGYTRSFSRPPR